MPTLDKRESLSELLLQRGLLSSAQLESLPEGDRQSQLRLQVALLKEGFLSECLVPAGGCLRGNCLA